MNSNAPKENNIHSSSGATGKILVTGANGQLGKELQQLSSHYPGYDFVFLSREDLPIDHFESVKRFFKEHHPDFCINCAAYTAVDKAESEKETAFQINGEAVGVLAAVCKEHNCRLLHISTDYVFDGEASVPYREESPVNPQSIYGASKLEGERLALQVNPDTVIIRTSWVYSEYGKNFVKTMLRLMREKKEINVVNDQYGSPTYAADLAEAILQIITKLTPHTAHLAPHIYHYSNQGIITWYEFALAIKELSGSKCRVNPITTAQYPTPAKRPAWSALDKTKIQETFGIVVKDWKESLGLCLQRINEVAKEQ